MVGCTVLARGLGFVISSMRLFESNDSWMYHSANFPTAYHE